MEVPEEKRQFDGTEESVLTAIDELQRSLANVPSRVRNTLVMYKPSKLPNQAQKTLKEMNLWSIDKLKWTTHNGDWYRGNDYSMLWDAAFLLDDEFTASRSEPERLRESKA
ncbi:hypothetical protein DFQ28_004889 [Apophysomyces sp. BC1034]|nr:hypothetical protein DFQ30_010118 [Apophysomyces sp. BC1015]KAG0178182.1 hypothetical protein DFQ29_003834 [Apophysomyces sp. BC1021]KAG0188428.1 hypothetical protein DFQ28_004889 [Apophysomyces sp. BC1034]